MPRPEPADAEMRIIRQDRPPRRRPAPRHRPGVRARLRPVEPLVGLVRRRPRPERQPPDVEHAEIRHRNRRRIQPLRHGELPCRPQWRHHRIQLEQSQRREPRAPDLVIGVADRSASRQHQIAHIPAQRHHAQDAIFQRQQRRVAFHLGDPRIDAGNIAFDARANLDRNPRQFGIQITAIVEQPRHSVVLREAPAINLRHPAQLAAVPKVDLEQPVACDDIALPEKGVRLGLGADVRHAPSIVDNLDRCRQTGNPRRRRCGRGLAAAGHRNQRRRRGAEQKQAAVEHRFSFLMNRREG